MALGTFRALVVDAADAGKVGAYWSSVLGLALSDEGFLELPVDGMAPRRMWFNDVPEPRVGPNRVRARLFVRSDEDAAALVELGGKALPEPGVLPVPMQDPEGNEFEAWDATPEEATRGIAFGGLVVDARDPVAQARFWRRVLGGQVSMDGTADARLSHVPSMPWGWEFAASDALKRVKNRWHWDVDLPAGVEVSELVKLGAAIVRPAAGEQWWTILVDPEGNEFCAFPPP